MAVSVHDATPLISGNSYTTSVDATDVSRRTFYRWRELGIAPACIRLPNGSLRIRREDFRAWLDQHSEQAA